MKPRDYKLLNELLRCSLVTTDALIFLARGLPTDKLNAYVDILDKITNANKAASDQLSLILDEELNDATEKQDG